MTDTSIDAESVRVDTRSFLALSAAPLRIRDQLDISLSRQTYLPRVDDLTTDWVAHVAVPAFKVLGRRRRDPLHSFCAIGTGSGLDVLAAIETLGPTRIGMTDVQKDIIAAAQNNVERNCQPSHPLRIEAGSGDLLEPLRSLRPRYDVIYENLPNVPLADPERIAIRRGSSLFLAPRTESIPDAVKRPMLDLHYLALLQAHDFLTPGGAVLSVLGSRVPLEVLLSVGRLAGYRPSILTYTWKVQADPQEIVVHYAEKQVQGFGPFHFYRADVLEAAFRSVDVNVSGERALDIERSLAPLRLDAGAARHEFEQGVSIGHTVAVMECEIP